MDDALADILELIKLNGCVYFRSDFSPPWGMEMPAGRFAQFHLVVRGRAVLLTGYSGSRCLELNAGDLILLPHGDAHGLADRPESPRMAAPAALEHILGGASPFAGEPLGATLVCGHFEFDHEANHPMIDSLPEMIVLSPSDGSDTSRIQQIANMILDELAHQRPGCRNVVDRLAEILLVHILRVHIERSGDPTGLIAGLRDSRIGRSLGLLHRSVGLDLDGVAREIGMSRAAFARRFKELVGMTPMAYGADWRLRQAREAIRKSSRSLADIAESAGYASEPSFHRAFKEKFGVAPGRFRRANQLRQFEQVD